MNFFVVKNDTSTVVSSKQKNWVKVRRKLDICLVTVKRTKFLRKIYRAKTGEKLIKQHPLIQSL